MTSYSSGLFGSDAALFVGPRHETPCGSGRGQRAGPSPARGHGISDPGFTRPGRPHGTEQPGACLEEAAC